MMDEAEINTQDTNDELYERFSIVIDRGQESIRIDKFLVNRIEGATRNKIQKAIDAGMVLVNEKEIKSNYKIRPLDSIIVYSDMDPDDS